MQTCAASLAACLLVIAAGCTGGAAAPSIWPPPDFDLVVEEMRVEQGLARVVRRFRAEADGLVVYATSSRAVVDASTGTALPVFDRLSVYRLVPTSIRALARRLDRCGILEMDRVQGERGSVDGPSLVLVWRAFDREQVLTARGRVHGAMSDVLAIVTSHLPDGETFGLPQQAERPVVPVLRGVPSPRQDAAGALQTHLDLLAEREPDAERLLDAFALACDLGQRSTAEQLLARWLEVRAVERGNATTAFPDEAPRLSEAILERMLPATR